MPVSVMPTTKKRRATKNTTITGATTTTDVAITNCDRELYNPMNKRNPSGTVYVLVSVKESNGPRKSSQPKRPEKMVTVISAGVSKRHDDMAANLHGMRAVDHRGRARAARYRSQELVEQEDMEDAAGVIRRHISLVGIDITSFSP